MRQKHFRPKRLNRWLRIGFAGLLFISAGCVGIDGGEQPGVGTPTETAPPNVRFDKQTTRGENVTVQFVSLPEDGYVAIHTSEMLQTTGFGRVVGVSGYLKAGTYRNVTINLYEVPGGDFNIRQLQKNRTLVAVVHRETSEAPKTPTFNFVTTNGREDGPYTANDSPIIDTAYIIARSEVNGNKSFYSTYHTLL